MNRRREMSHDVELGLAGGAEIKGEEPSQLSPRLHARDADPVAVPRLQAGGATRRRAAACFLWGRPGVTIYEAARWTR